MQVLSTPSPLPHRALPPKTKTEEAARNPLEADSFLFDFPSYQGQLDSEVQELPSSPAPELQRPVLLVHGFTSSPGAWQNMHTWLIQANPDGGVVNGNSQPDPQGKVFRMEFSRPYNPLSNNAAELRQAVDRICAATGASEIDVVGHSMGGLDTRLYIDQGNEKVQNLVMIGTPNHGSVLADIELTFRELGLPIKPPTDDPLVRQALTDLSEVRGDNNPVLAQLNKNLPRQRDRARMLTIAGNGTPTLANRFWLTIRGDGTVSQASAKLPEVEHRNIWWTNHNGVKDHPKALEMTAAFLTGRPVPLDDPEPPDVPDDKEIVPEQISADQEQLHYVIRS